MSQKTVKCELCKKYFPVAEMFIHRQYQCEKRLEAKGKKC